MHLSLLYNANMNDWEISVFAVDCCLIRRGFVLGNSVIRKVMERRNGEGGCEHHHEGWPEKENGYVRMGTMIGATVMVRRTNLKIVREEKRII